MDTEEIIEYLCREGWHKAWNEDSERDDRYEDFRYDRNWADCIWDELTIWKTEKRIDVTYQDIGWGYTNYENHSFTYEEFVDWWKSKN